MAKIVGIFEVLVWMNLRLTCVLVESLLVKSSASALIFTCLQTGVCACPNHSALLYRSLPQMLRLLRKAMMPTCVTPFSLLSSANSVCADSIAGVSVLEVQESEPVWDLKGLVYNLACQHCWRPGESTVSEAEEADD